MTKKRLLLIAIPIASCAGCLLWIFQPLSPARQSDEAIREEILRATPLGSTAEAVEKYARSRFGGRFVTQNNSIWLMTDDGRKQIWVSYGGYPTIRNFPLATGVEVVWNFSKDDVLIDVRVWRMQAAVGTG